MSELTEAVENERRRSHDARVMLEATASAGGVDFPEVIRHVSAISSRGIRSGSCIRCPVSDIGYHQRPRICVGNVPRISKMMGRDCAGNETQGWRVRDKEDNLSSSFEVLLKARRLRSLELTSPRLGKTSGGSSSSNLIRRVGFLSFSSLGSALAIQFLWFSSCGSVLVIQFL